MLILYFAQSVLIPLGFSILLAIVLLPLTNFLERHRFPAALANIISIFFALIIIGTVLYFLSSQISNFLKDIPSIKKHLSDHYLIIQDWVQRKIHISSERQAAMLSNAAEKVKDSGTVYIGQTFLTITQTILLIVLVVVYTFFILYQRHMIRNFFFSVFKKVHKTKVAEVLVESKNIVQKYITGLLIEMAIVATINSIVLLIIGIKYAIFFGVFAAILNLIPYVGIFISILFTALVTLTTSASMGNILWLMIGMEAVHFTDANFIMPKIVGSKVKINALIAIVAVVIGATFAGIAGIFLALPTIAILKVIFDRVDGLKPWGMLMGDETLNKKPKLYQKIQNITSGKLAKNHAG
jgi:predicted PurR-regulated permease PerM